MAPRLAPEPVAARTDWSVWSTTASVVVERPDAISRARALAEEFLGDVGAACSRFDPASELSRLGGDPATNHGVEVSELLAELVQTALVVAEQTGGSVDPTLGLELNLWGYDRDFDQLPSASQTDFAEPHGSVSVEVRGPRWKEIRLDGRMLTMPSDIRLDLGATAKAFAADRIAARIADDLATGVLVSLGGDIAAAGRTARQGWEVLVRDLDTDPSQQVFLPDGSAIATSSTQKRTWMRGGRRHQHILDPTFGVPVTPAWRSATVAATDCVGANALSTAAIVRGRDAARWLTERGAAARLVDLEGRVVTTAGWPSPEEGAS